VSTCTALPAGGVRDAVALGVAPLLSLPLALVKEVVLLLLLEEEEEEEENIQSKKPVDGSGMFMERRSNEAIAEWP